MKLAELVRNLNLLDEADTIYAAEPWTCDSEAVATPEPEIGGMEIEVQGRRLTYFLEIAVAREVLEGWRKNLDESPSVIQECVRLIQYAINDA